MLSRRVFFTVLAGTAATRALASPAQISSTQIFAQARTGTPEMSRPTAYAFSFPALDGGAIRLVDYAGKPVLVVNTASLCGYTPQYTGLQTLWSRYRNAGLTIIGVPSNDFGGQEPGDATEINHTAHDQYKIDFPLAAKAVVTGPERIGFYRWAALERPADPPRWNFHKYLIGRDGHIVASFSSEIEPMDARMIAAIERELRAGA